jgi:hypothetical protein
MVAGLEEFLHAVIIVVERKLSGTTILLCILLCASYKGLYMTLLHFIGRS